MKLTSVKISIVLRMSTSSVLRSQAFSNIKCTEITGESYKVHLNSDRFRLLRLYWSKGRVAGMKLPISGLVERAK